MESTSLKKVGVICRPAPHQIQKNEGSFISRMSASQVNTFTLELLAFFLMMAFLYALLCMAPGLDQAIIDVRRS